MIYIISQDIVKQYKKEIKEDKKLSDKIIRKKIESIVKVSNKNIIDNECVHIYKGNRIVTNIMSNKIINAKFVPIEYLDEISDVYVLMGLNSKGNKLTYNNQLPSAKEIKNIIKNNNYNIKFVLDKDQLYPLYFTSGNDEFCARIDENGLFEMQHFNDKYNNNSYIKNKMHTHFQRRYGQLKDMLESIHNHTRFKCEEYYRSR